MNGTSKPADIERNSLSIIEEELARQGILLPPEEAPVVKRVIHATADFDFASTLTFTPGAVPQGIASLKNWIPVITDTNMARAGISTAGLRKLGGEVLCFMADQEVAAEARRAGTTRAAAAVRYAATRYPSAVFALGNAPTALLELAEKIEGGYRPALVIAVPVGFVNVVEAKERILAVCQACGVPAIAAMGRKGGSSVAAAVCNALLYQAADMTDPASRGW